MKYKFLLLSVTLIFGSLIIGAFTRRETPRRPNVTPVRGIRVEPTKQVEAVQKGDQENDGDDCEDVSKCGQPTPTPPSCRGECTTPTPRPTVEPTDWSWPYPPLPTVEVTPYP